MVALPGIGDHRLRLQSDLPRPVDQVKTDLGQSNIHSIAGLISDRRTQTCERPQKSAQLRQRDRPCWRFRKK